jgi:hypothetical protein
MKETHHSPSKERYPTSIKKLAHYWQMGPCELFKQRPTCRHPLPDSSNVLNSGQVFDGLKKANISYSLAVPATKSFGGIVNKNQNFLT